MFGGAEFERGFALEPFVDAEDLPGALDLVGEDETSSMTP
jgi:hypothetical protein